MKRKYLCFLLIALFAVPLLLFAQDSTAVIPANVELVFPTWLVTGIGLLIPVFSQLITRWLKTSNQKFFVSLALQVISGVAGAFIIGIDISNLPVFLGAVFVLAQLSYRLWWKALFASPVGEAAYLKPVEK